MTNKWPLAALASLSLLGCGVEASRSGEADVLSVEKVFERSGEAYRAHRVVEITLTTVVELPNTDPGERVVRYVLGEGEDAELHIVPLLRVVAAGDTLYMERPGLEDRYLATPLDGDLASTLASVRGEATLAGLWEPPQAALRAGRPLAQVIDALRYSRLLGELVVVDSRRLPDSRHEVRLEADNGSLAARFDAASFFLEEIEFVVRPGNAPRGYAMHAKGRYETKPLDDAQDVPRFEPGERTSVEAFRDLAAPSPGVGAPPADVVSPERLVASLLDLDSLAKVVRGKRVLLVGEDHLYNEPPAYLTSLLERLDDRPIILLLELPYDAQPRIERYIEEGDEQAFAEIFAQQVLQLQHVLRWARANPDQLLRVEAIDEPLYEISLKRAYLSDTRNRTMANAIYRMREDHPEARVVVYAGQLHMMTAGRYRWNQPSRDPAGSRILRMGVPRDEVVTIMLNGGENFHLHEVWPQPGALPMVGDFAQIPISYFIDYPIFGATNAGEIFDYFVNLGPLTMVEMP